MLNSLSRFLTLSRAHKRTHCTHHARCCFAPPSCPGLACATPRGSDMVRYSCTGGEKSLCETQRRSGLKTVDARDGEVGGNGWVRGEWVRMGSGLNLGQVFFFSFFLLSLFSFYLWSRRVLLRLHSLSLPRHPHASAIRLIVAHFPILCLSVREDKDRRTILTLCLPVIHARCDCVGEMRLAVWIST